MRRCIRAFIVSSIVISLFASKPALGQTEAPASQVETMKTERGIFLAAAPAGEREITFERETPLEAAGLPRLEVAGFRITGFAVGSFSYNSHVQAIPEFAGNATTFLSDPGSTNFRFDKAGIALFRTFAPWLSGGVAIEVESHPERHSHGFNRPAGASPSGFGCPSGGTIPCTERFGSEEAETEVTLDKFNLTAIAPIGNGLAFSIGRFDVPFGIERHDEPLLLTATQSEIFDFGRPERMTGLQVSYAFAPWLDASAWVVNRWESETTEDTFDDTNRDKSFGGRIGVTPFPRGQLLNFGAGGFWGPEQEDNNHDKRWVVDVDVTWEPIPGLLLAGEAVYGGEDHVSFREVGGPAIAAPAVEDKNVNWWGLYALAHYDFVDWLGLSVRYGHLQDMDGARTGVEQVLQSWTIVPVLHLSRLIPDLRPTGAAYARTRHPINWVDLKFEYRVNHSNRPVFFDVQPGEDLVNGDKTSHQLQVQAVVNF